MKSKLLIVACLVIVLSMALILPLFIVNADYSDIVNDPNSIVNFNQQFNMGVWSDSNGGVNFTLNQSQVTFEITNNYTTTSDAYSFSSNHITLDTTHYYYCFNTDNRFGSLFMIEGQSGYQNTINTIFKPTSNSYGVSVVYGTSIPVGSYEVYYNLIDLSLMFGLGSEPSLEQCQNLFVADYYNYNTGTAMSFGSVNAYQQALSDITNSYSFNLSVSALGLNSFAYNYKNVTSIFNFNQQYNFWYYQNTFGTPLFTTLSSGTRLDIEFNMYAANSGYQEHLHLAVWYLNNQSDLVNIYIDPQGINYYSDEVNNLSFVLPTSVDTLYFNVYDDRTQAVDTASNSFVLLFNISAQQFDLNTAITNAFITGQRTIMSSYQVGGDKYQEIWNAGYQYGLNADTPYTFANLMSSVVEAPLSAVLSIFNFEFLGYNFRNVITLILTLCIILSIIRLFVGMGASE